jgi:hypothetical protein
MRFYYKLLQKGKPKNQSLTHDRIERLEEIGFQWVPYNIDKIFEERFRDLETFKRKFGHCNVPKTYSMLGQWCIGYRTAYRRMDDKKTTGKKNENYQPLSLQIE